MRFDDAADLLDYLKIHHYDSDSSDEYHRDDILEWVVQRVEHNWPLKEIMMYAYELVLEKGTGTFASWALRQGMVQFEQYFDWGGAESNEIAYILTRRPKYLDKFDLKKLDSVGVRYIIQDQPQLMDVLDLSVLEKNEIYHLAEGTNMPLKLLDLSKLTNEELGRIIEKRPHVESYIRKFFKETTE